MMNRFPIDTTVSYDPPFGEPDRDGDQGFEILPDGKAKVRIKAPDAKEVALDQFGNMHPLARVSDEMWEGTVDLGRGFQYFFLKVDGADVLCPYLPIGYGCCRPMNFLDIPVPGEEEWGILDDIPHGAVTRHYFPSTITGKQEICLVYTPASYDPNKKYPTILYCEGGPQSPVSQFWSFRWNFMMMSAGDYIIVAPNRRGLPGFGKEWNEEISGDYGGQCMTDLLTAIDEFCTEPYVDKNRLGCVGASFGGYSVYWLAGHHEGRFKAFIAHDGIFNLEMQYLETEEKWFANWDLGGAYWEKDNDVAQRTYANSPHRFVDKWDTPILCIHGEKDYRILANQAMAAFDAAKMRGVPAELLIFPDENHWVLKPQNGILWQREFRGWLDKWLK